MAKSIATIGGIALAPGVSANGRLYTREAIAKMVTRGQARIKAGTQPLTMLSHHGAGDDSLRIAGQLSSLSLDGDGAARFTAGIADNDAGRNIAALLDTSDGKPAYLRNVSIRGAWASDPHEVKGPDGKTVTTASDLELAGLDYTKDPGVALAAIDAFTWSDQPPGETTERVLITESVQEACVTAITEETGADEGGNAPGDGSKPYGNVVYADPGYQADKKKRYPLSTAAKIRSAWSYVNQKDNAAKYSAAQLKRIKGKIKAAMKGIGATVTAEWVYFPAEQVTEGVSEFYGDPGMDGSFCITATNGPLNVSVSSYCVDPADLDLILRAAADAACAAMKLIDPDMDGDMDIPGADSEDTDGDAGETAAVLEPVTETETTNPPGDPAGDQGPAPAGPQTETEVPGMPDTATEAAGDLAAATETASIPGTVETVLTASRPAGVTLTDEQFAALLGKFTDREPAAAAKIFNVAPAATETAAVPAAVTETDDERIARIVAEQVAAAIPPPVAETEDQKIERLVKAGVQEAQQRLVASGAVDLGRKGLAVTTEGSATPNADVSLNEYGLPATWPNKPLHEYSPDELTRFAGPALDHHIMGRKAVTTLL